MLSKNLFTGPFEGLKINYSQKIKNIGVSFFTSRDLNKGYKKIEYLVKKGDTLGEIAEIYHTRASKLRAWNGLYYGQHIYPKQKLKIWVPQDYASDSGSLANREVNLPEGSYHVVKWGDTLWDIAQKYDISIHNLKKINNKRL